MSGEGAAQTGILNETFGGSVNCLNERLTGPTPYFYWMCVCVCACFEWDKLSCTKHTDLCNMLGLPHVHK